MAADDKTFILSESGHVAGIVNPPGKDKYGHYVDGTGYGGSSEDWQESASFRQGSWWPHWGEWLSARAGKLVAARRLDDALEPAPGQYVHERS